MNNLVVLLDASAPSFCYYEPPADALPHPMTRETFARVVAFADSNALTLQLVCGRGGVDGFVDELVGARPHMRYQPLGSAECAPGDILVVNGPRWDARPLPPSRHATCVLRMRRENLAELPEAWERLSQYAYRVVLVMTDLDRYDEVGLERYRTALVDLRQRLAAKYLRAEATELSVLSDRLGLEVPSECGAGVDHLTVMPSGELHICPGFALDGEPPVGNLADGWQIPNAELFERSKAPICSSCDAYHCRRCVYLNHRATLEPNTPPWQVCRAVHMEREASRVMLAILHERRCLERILPIAPLDYDDPLDKLMQVRHSLPRGVSAVPRQGPRSKDSHRTEPTTTKGADRRAVAPDRRVGRVTPAERDEIQQLHRQRVGLSALVSTLARMDDSTLRSSPLYERLVRDMGETVAAYDDWWSRLAIKYGWTRQRADQSWRVNFVTGDILLNG